MSTILGNAYVRIRPDTSGFDSATKSSIGKTLSGLGSLATKALAGAFTAVGAAGGIGLKVAADMETARIGFTTMLGSAQKANDFLQKLQKFAAETPFEFPELQTAASSLISIGIDANKVIPIMTTLGNVTSGMGTGSEGVKRATVALQQMNAAGKISAEDLNQLRDAGIPVFDLLTAATGKTKEEISAMAQSGKLGRKELEQLMAALESGKGLERFNGLMEKQSQSLSGLFSTLKDTVQMNLATAMDPFIPSIKAAMEKAAPALDTGLKAFSAFSQRAVETVRTTLGPGLKDFFTGGDFTGAFVQLGIPVSVVQDLERFRDSFASIFGSVRDIAQQVGPILGVALGGGLRLAYDAFKLALPAIEAVLGYLADSPVALWAVVGVIGAITLAMKAHEAAMAVSAAGGVVEWIKQTKIASSITKVWTAIQWAFNAAMSVNPLVLVGIALAALVAGLVLAWQHSETFRNVVMGALHAVADAGKWMWESVLKPVWEALKTAWDAVATGIQWAWQNIIQPVFDVLGKVAQALAITLMVVVFGPIMLAWKALSLGIQWAWENVLKPAWDAVAAAAGWLWDTILKPYFTFILDLWTAIARGIWTVWSTVLKVAWDAVAAAAGWLWDTILKPVFGFIGAAWSALLNGISWAWSNILKPAWDAVSAAASWLWGNVLQPVFGAIGSAWSALASGFQWVFDHLLRPVFDAFSSVVGTVKDGFGTAVDWIKRAWEGMKDGLMKPVQWVIDFVWNDGLRKLWNTINNLWGGDDLQPFKLARGGVIPGDGNLGGGGNSARAYATGGVMPGYTPGRDVHRFFSPTGGLLDLSGGEAVMRPEFTKALGVERVNALNAAARRGGVAAVAEAMGLGSQAHKKGGLIDLPGWLGTAIKWIPGMGVVGNVIDALNGGDTGPGMWGDAIWSTVKKIGSSLWDKAKSLFGGSEAGAQGGGPAGSGAIGGGAWTAIWNLVHAAIPAARINSTYRPGDPGYHGRGKAVDFGFGSGPGGNGSPGLASIKRFLHDTVGSNLAELIYDGVGNDRPDLKNGRPLTYNAATRAEHHNHVHAAVYDDGGVLPPGLAVNLSRKPEAVFNHDQWGVLKDIANGGGTSPLIGGDLVLQVAPGSDVRDQMESAMFELRRIRRGGGVR